MLENEESERLNIFNKPIEIKLKNIIILLIIALSIYLLIPKMIGMEKTISLIKNLNKGWLLVALIMEFISYASAAWFQGIILSKLGYEIPFMERFKIGSITTFAIHFFPLGSFGGSVLTYDLLRKRNVTSGSVLLLLLLRVTFTYIGFLIVFLIGLLSVPYSPNLPFSPKLISTILFIIILGLGLYWVYLYNNKTQFEKVWKRLTRVANYFLKLFHRPRINAEQRGEIFDDLHTGMKLFSDKKHSLTLAVLSTVIYWLGDILCLFFIFKGFGYFINPGVLIFGYGVATLAGLITFIPGGVGITEGSMGLIYSGLGVSFPLAIMSILVFRFFSFWIWIPIGFYSYITLKRGIHEDS